MSRFTSITNDIWLDKEFRNMEANDKLLYFFLLTNPYVNQCGFYRLPLCEVERNLGEYESLLKNSKLWKYDQANEVVLLPNYLKYNVAKNNMQLKGINTCLKTLPNTPLIIDFMYRFIRYSTDNLSFLDNIVKKEIEFQLMDREDKESTLVRSYIYK